MSPTGMDTSSVCMKQFMYFSHYLLALRQPGHSRSVASYIGYWSLVVVPSRCVAVVLFHVKMS
jgi:hypothetical protein